MKIPHLRRIAPLTLIASCLALAPRAQAITIDFGTDQGYSTTGGQIDSGEAVADGNLAGQPSVNGATKWSAPTSTGTDVIDIVPDTIDGTGQMAQLSYGGSTNQPYYTFSPSATDLGGTFSNTSSDLTFSLQLAVTAGSAGGRFEFGSSNNNAYSLQLELLSSGEIDYKSGTTEYYVTTDGMLSISTAASDDLKLNSGWTTISGDINYANDTFDLTVDGHSTGNLAFISTASGDTSTLYIRDLVGTNSDVDLDNLSLSVAAPEPGTASLTLLGGGCAFLLWLRRRNLSSGV